MFLCVTAFPRPKLPLGYFHGYVKENKRTSHDSSRTELKSTVNLLPEVAWPIIMQNVANTGSRLLCSELTSDTLG